MNLTIHKNYQSLSSAVAREIIETIKMKPDAVLCLAAGDTPRLTYNLMTNYAAHEKVDFSQCRFVGLDEWVGIPPSNEGSCHFFLHEHIFKPLNISPHQVHLFDAMTSDLTSQCDAMDKIILDNGGIDLMLVGIGLNGHIGFNEPGVPFDKLSHVINLDDATQTVGQKYFKETSLIKYGITLGLHHFLNARKAILIANGIKKSAVIREALEEEISPRMPASVIRLHTNGLVMIDEEAGSLLKKV